MKRLLLAFPFALAACDSPATAPLPSTHRSLAITATGTCTFTTVGSTNYLNGDCTTPTSIVVPNGETLDGGGFTITAVDPAFGHFLGAVITNGGAVANVTNVRVTASGLSDVCDAGADRLRGILFEGAGGSITGTVVTGVRQGLSGCQEGNAIEVRNAPFDGTGSDLLVNISGNQVSDYQKNGITVNGAVAATVTDNTVAGDGPVSYIAQNGIQISRGATAIVQANAVSQNDYTGFDVACGILLFDAGGVKESTNRFSKNERNMCNFGKGGGKFNPTP